MEFFFVSSSFISFSDSFLQYNMSSELSFIVPNKMGSVKLQNNPIKTDV